MSVIHVMPGYVTWVCEARLGGSLGTLMTKYAVNGLLAWLMILSEATEATAQCNHRQHLISARGPLVNVGRETNDRYIGEQIFLEVVVVVSRD